LDDNLFKTNPIKGSIKENQNLKEDGSFLMEDSPLIQTDDELKFASEEDLKLIDELSSMLTKKSQKPVFYDFDLDSSTEKSLLLDSDHELDSEIDSDSDIAKACEILGIDKNNKEERAAADIFLHDSDDELNITIKKSIKENDVLDLSAIKRKYAIELLEKETHLNLNDCLQKTFTTDNLDSKRTCSYCNQKCDFTKTNTLWTLPEYLIIQLKRFEQHTGNKKQHFIDFTEYLDVEPFMDTDLLEHLKTSTKYRLKSVINHTGTITFGHYYTYSRNDIDGIWYETNDRTVRVCNNVVTSYAYILVYQHV